jgi:hypothetical protein
MFPTGENVSHVPQPVERGPVHRVWACRKESIAMATLICVFLASAILLTLLGVPLFRGKVPPNALYGFRVQATLDDPAVWYPVNRLSGLWLFVTGAVLFLSSVILYVLVSDPGTAAGVNLSVLGICLTASIVHGLIVTNRLTKARRR